MSSDVVDNSVIEIKPGDTCEFNVCISFSKEHVFDRHELHSLLQAWIREFFNEE